MRNSSFVVRDFVVQLVRKEGTKMNEMEWGAWSVEYNPQSEMYDVFCRKDEETRIHSSWCKKTTAEKVADKLNRGEQI